jgi:hypothetical protein
MAIKRKSGDMIEGEVGANASPADKGAGTLRQVSVNRGIGLLSLCKRRIDVMDLDYMSIAITKDEALKISGKFVADSARTFADIVEAKDDCREHAQRYAKSLIMMTSKPVKLGRGWSDLAALAFWTARNAIYSWDYPIDETSLRSRDLEYWVRPEEPKRTGPETLGLRLHPTVNLHTGDILIVAPEWFLSARDLSIAFDERAPSEDVLKLARETLSDYFKQLVFSETLPEGKQRTYRHPCVESLLDSFRPAGVGPLEFSAYGHHSNKRPSDIVNALMNGVKGKLRTLGEWVFFPWKQTLLGWLKPLPTGGCARFPLRFNRRGDWERGARKFRFFFVGNLSERF